MTNRPTTWLASYPKSGNTWLRMFLDCYISGRELDINDLDSRTCRGDLDPLAYQAASIVPLPEIDHEHHVLIRGAALLNMTARHEHSILKTHFEHNAAWIPPQLTRGAIYLIRDPRDVAISWASHCEISIDKAIDHLTTRMVFRQESGLAYHCGTWASHVASWQEHAEVFRYEDLLSDPTQFGFVLSAAGMTCHHERAKWALEQVSFANLQAQEQKHGFIEKRGGEAFFRQGIAGAWKEILTSQQVERIEESCGTVMRKHGYELSIMGAVNA